MDVSTRAFFGSARRRHEDRPVSVRRDLAQFATCEAAPRSALVFSESGA